MGGGSKTTGGAPVLVFTNCRDKKKDNVGTGSLFLFVPCCCCCWMVFFYCFFHLRVNQKRLEFDHEPIKNKNWSTPSHIEPDSITSNYIKTTIFEYRYFHRSGFCFPCSKSNPAGNWTRWNQWRSFCALSQTLAHSWRTTRSSEQW